MASTNGAFFEKINDSVILFGGQKSSSKCKVAFAIVGIVVLILIVLFGIFTIYDFNQTTKIKGMFLNKI